MKFTLEFKLQDFWVGFFWKRAGWLDADPSDLSRRTTDEIRSIIRTDLWICLFPCLPFHFWWNTVVETWNASSLDKKYDPLALDNDGWTPVRSTGLEGYSVGHKQEQSLLDHDMQDMIGNGLVAKEKKR